MAPHALMRVSDRVWAIRTPTADLTSGLVVGSAAALVVDTGSGAVQAGRILDDVRAVTDLPLLVLNTHDHWDHWFGNAVFVERAGVQQIWGPSGVADRVVAQHAEAVEWGAGPPGVDDLVAPERLVVGRVDLELGECPVRLLPLAGHTRHDVVALVDEVALTGDLVEQSGPPQFDETSDVRWWVASLDALLDLNGIRTFVPGHGVPVGREHLADQRAWLAGRD